MINLEQICALNCVPTPKRHVEILNPVTCLCRCHQAKMRSYQPGWALIQGLVSLSEEANVDVCAGDSVM